MDTLNSLQNIDWNLVHEQKLALLEKDGLEWAAELLRLVNRAQDIATDTVGIDVDIVFPHSGK